MPVPELSVVVASHERPLRLRWLLNALAEQTLDRHAFEVIVGHDSGPETEALLATHPLAAAGVLHAVRTSAADGRPAPPGANRNSALALARGATVVFTDDDCRPPAEWLERVRDAVRAQPDAVIQGPVIPDPDELVMLRSPHPRTQNFTAVPRPWAECANIAYPRALLTRLGGFREDMRTGEDCELARRAAQAGVRIAGDPGMLTHHAVDEGGVRDALRAIPRWADLALLVRRHPGVRAHLTLGVFWKREHALLLLAIGGLAAARPSRGASLIAVLPWALARNAHGTTVRGRVRQLAGLPGWLAIDLAEIAVLARASLAHRTLVL